MVRKRFGTIVSGFSTVYLRGLELRIVVWVMVSARDWVRDRDSVTVVVNVVMVLGPG